MNQMDFSWRKRNIRIVTASHKFANNTSESESSEDEFQGLTIEAEE